MNLRVSVSRSVLKLLVAVLKLLLAALKLLVAVLILLVASDGCSADAS